MKVLFQPKKKIFLMLNYTKSNAHLFKDTKNVLIIKCTTIELGMRIVSELCQC